MFARKSNPPSDNQLKAEEVAELDKLIQDYEASMKGLCATDKTLIQWLAFAGLTLSQTYWSFVIVMTGVGIYKEFETAHFRELWKLRSEQDSIYQQQLAKLLGIYQALIYQYGKNITYDKNFLKLTRLIINYVPKEDLVPVELALSPEFNIIFSKSCHKQTFVDTTDNLIPALKKGGDAKNQMNGSNIFGIFRTIYDNGNYYLYGLKPHYRYMLPKNESVNAKSADNVITTFLHWTGALNLLVSPAK